MDRQSIIMQAIGIVLIAIIVAGDALTLYALANDWPWVVHNALMIVGFVCFCIVSNIALIVLLIIFYQAFKPMGYDRKDNSEQQNTD